MDPLINPLPERETGIQERYGGPEKERVMVTFRVVTLGVAPVKGPSSGRVSAYHGVRPLATGEARRRVGAETNENPNWRCPVSTGSEC